MRIVFHFATLETLPCFSGVLQFLQPVFYYNVSLFLLCQDCHQLELMSALENKRLVRYCHRHRHCLREKLKTDAFGTAKVGTVGSAGSAGSAGSTESAGTVGTVGTVTMKTKMTMTMMRLVFFFFFVQVLGCFLVVAVHFEKKKTMTVTTILYV